MMEFYEHHSQFNNLRSTNQNRELITRNNNHLDQSAVSVPTQLLTSKRLDLLSEHPEKNLSQNLFNKNSYQVKRFDQESQKIKDRVFYIDDGLFSIETVYFLKSDENMYMRQSPISKINGPSRKHSPENARSFILDKTVSEYIR